MSDPSLRGRHILVVEDEYMLSEDVRELLEADGAVVLGPVARIGTALTVLSSADRIDGAVLDINLQGEMVFPLADELRQRGIPFLFATGYDAEAIPERFGGVLRCEKPMNGELLRRSLQRLLPARTTPDASA